MSAAEILSEDVFRAWEALDRAEAGGGPRLDGGAAHLSFQHARGTAPRFGRQAGAGLRGRVARPGRQSGRAGRGGRDVGCAARHRRRATGTGPTRRPKPLRGDWIYTGDRFLEKDGYYYFQGRADDLIKVSGQWGLANGGGIVPQRPSGGARMRGARPPARRQAHGVARDRQPARWACWRRRPGQGVAGPCETHAAAVQYPRFVEFIDELPKTGTGKIDRQALAAICRFANPISRPGEGLH